MDYETGRTKFVVGLGNPGRRYARTRHNVGWMVLAKLRERWAVGGGRASFAGQVYDGRSVAPDGVSRRVMLFEPHLYMNRSGEAVKGLLSFYKPDHRDVLVVLDDMALPAGRLRARASGSGGGHNGLKDVLRLLGTDELPRLRIGIGESPPEMDPADYVLTPFGSGEMEIMDPAIEQAADAVEDWAHRDINYVMETYNRRPDAPETPEERNGNAMS